MMSNPELEEELKLLAGFGLTNPLFYDIKGRQLRVVDVHDNPRYLDLTLNHPINVDTPTPVLFKAGSDRALLREVTEGGRRLIFDGGPKYLVRPGESLHIRHPSLQVGGQQFTDAEKDKIARVRQAGFQRYFLSYVESQADVDEFQELVGPEAEIWLKIESKRGLEYVRQEWRLRPNLTLVAARGDLYVEIDRPHDIMDALKLIIAADPRACVASRMFLSIVTQPVPECCDFLELAWLYDIGYRRMMLCDEICLKESLLAPAINAFDAFRQAYVPSVPTPVLA